MELQTKHWGIRTTTLNSGAVAIQKLKSGSLFDMIILDMQMPEMDGLDLARHIRNIEAYQTVPLVMFTSVGNQEVMQQNTEIKFAAILNKPIQQSLMADALAKVFSAMKSNSVQAKSPERTTKEPLLGETNPLKILLADDVAVNQKVAQLLLKQLGYQADFASNGLEVLDSLKRQSYDVILMDVHMPEMDGMMASQKIKAEWPVDQCPRIIALTANAMQGDREKCLESGMDDFVTKPIQPLELRHALSKCKPLQELSQVESLITEEDNSIFFCVPPSARAIAGKQTDA
jgi:CheY-like chemotaxis protein